MNRAKKDAPPRFPEFREAFLELELLQKRGYSASKMMPFNFRSARFPESDTIW